MRANREFFQPNREFKFPVPGKNRDISRLPAPSGNAADGASRLKGPDFSLLNVFRKKLIPELKRAVAEQNELFRPRAVLIEDKASGTQLIQELLAARMSNVTRYKPDGDKIMRLHAQTAVIENGFVHLPAEAPWLADTVRN